MAVVSGKAAIVVESRAKLQWIQLADVRMFGLVSKVKDLKIEAQAQAPQKSRKLKSFKVTLVITSPSQPTTTTQ